MIFKERKTESWSIITLFSPVQHFNFTQQNLFNVVHAESPQKIMDSVNYKLRINSSHSQVK